MAGKAWPIRLATSWSKPPNKAASQAVVSEFIAQRFSCADQDMHARG